MSEQEIVPVDEQIEKILPQGQDEKPSKELVRSAEAIEAKSPFEKALTGLAADRSRSLGGETSAKLLAAMTQHFANDNSEKKLEIVQLREKVEKLQHENSSLNSENSKLKERIKAFVSTNNIKTFAVFLGPVLFGFGIRFSQAGQDTNAKIFCCLGALSIFFGWYLLPKGDENGGDKK